MLARLNPGAHAMFQRRLVNNEIWLPAQVHFTGSARVLLVKGVRVDTTSEYSGLQEVLRRHGHDLLRPQTHAVASGA